jgi:hypothetical protein
MTRLRSLATPAEPPQLDMLMRVVIVGPRLVKVCVIVESKAQSYEVMVTQQ